MSPLRLIATDLDGTLVRSDFSVSQRSIDVLAAARARGIKVVLITGRPKRWAVEVSSVIPVDAVVVANGGLVYDGSLTEILISRLLDPPHALEFGRAMRAADPAVHFAAERIDGFVKEPDYLVRWPNPETHDLPFEEVLSEPMVKMLVRHEGLNADELLDAALQVVGDHGVALTHSSTEGLLEVSALGVDKGSTLALLAASWGIAAEECVTFGDMPNDASMLRWSGQSYAVANAHPTAKAAAKAHTLGVEEDGVAAILEKIFGT